MKAVNQVVTVGICGLGTVGSGTLNVLQRNAAEIERRCGQHIEVVQLASRSMKPEWENSGIAFSTDPLSVANNPKVDVVVELMGGCDMALEVVKQAILQGKHVVTANKALIATHGNELFSLAQKKGVILAFEAAVAGGIPVIKAIREGMAGNRIQWLVGIINGTSNYILSEMREKGRSFSEALKDAQSLGYAEADPTFDVEGIDAAHKLTILASIAFGIPLQFKAAYTEGISEIQPTDIEQAQRLGYRIKHLGIAKATPEGIELRVHPTLVPAHQMIANANGVMNAIMVHGDAVGDTLYYGAGAGGEPTASAVVADVVDVVRAMNMSSKDRVPHLGFHPETFSHTPILPIEACVSAFYLRLEAKDEPGVLAKVAAILSDAGINIESIMQLEAEAHGGIIPIILVTHAVRESRINDAIRSMEALTAIQAPVVRIRVEALMDIEASQADSQ